MERLIPVYLEFVCSTVLRCPSTPLPSSMRECDQEERCIGQTGSTKPVSNPPSNADRIIVV